MTVAATTAVISLVPGVVGEAVGDACRFCVCMLLGRAGLTVATEVVEDHRGEVTAVG